LATKSTEIVDQNSKRQTSVTDEYSEFPVTDGEQKGRIRNKRRFQILKGGTIY